MAGLLYTEIPYQTKYRVTPFIILACLLYIQISHQGKFRVMPFIILVDLLRIQISHKGKYWVMRFIILAGLLWIQISHKGKYWVNTGSCLLLSWPVCYVFKYLTRVNLASRLICRGRSYLYSNILPG